MANLDHITAEGAQPNTFNRQKFHNNCYKHGERGHFAGECPQIFTSKQQIVLPPAHPPQTVPVTHTSAPTTQIIPTAGPPKVIQTIISEGQLPTGAWNALLKQVGQAQAENKQTKKFVKKYVPFKKNYQNQKQNAKPSIETQQHDDKVPKVSKIEMHNEPEDDEDYILWNLHMMNNEDAEAAE